MYRRNKNKIHACQIHLSSTNVRRSRVFIFVGFCQANTTHSPASTAVHGATMQKTYKSRFIVLSPECLSPFFSFFSFHFVLSAVSTLSTPSHGHLVRCAALPSIWMDTFSFQWIESDGDNKNEEKKKTQKPKQTQKKNGIAHVLSIVCLRL